LKTAVFSLSAEDQSEDLCGGVILGRLSQSPPFLAEWGALVAGLPHAEPFLHPAWTASFAKSFVPGHEARIFTARREGGLCGVLPLMTARSFFLCKIPARTLRSMSGLHSCRFDLTTHQLARQEVAGVMWQQLSADPSWDVIEALDIPTGGNFDELLQIALREGYLVSRWRTRLSPYLSLPRAGAEPFSNCPHRYRKARARLAGARQRLSQLGGVRFEAITRPEERHIQTFIDLEASGWKGRSGGAIANRLATRSFYLELARNPELRGMSRVYSLWVDRTPVAMELGLVMKGRYYSPKACYNEDFSSFSPGHLLVSDIIKALSQEGIHHYDFLGAWAKYKAVWAGGISEHSNCYIFRPSLRGRFLYTLVEQVASRVRRVKWHFLGDPQVG
jgi:CelD/BcsL family acetyltransferase involved in cellulose biosynthesis